MIYELHVGTFTVEGTYEAAARELPALARSRDHRRRADAGRRIRRRFRVGIRRRRSLGARRTSTGRPTICAASSTARTRVGLGVILDVVYNHLGPDGNYLKAFAPDYFSAQHGNEWGEGLNFDGPRSEAVRDFFVGNAGYWIDEFHFDGLRLDAAHAIHDESPEHVLAAIGRRVREAAGDRATLIVAEHEPQETRLVEPAKSGGYGLDAVWNDDFHHAARVALTGRNEAYYRDYLGRPAGADLGAALGLPLPGPVVPLAEAAARNARPRSRRRALRALPRQSRPGRQLAGRRAHRGAHVAGPTAGDDGADAARAGNADAVPGAGVRRAPAVSLLRRP